MACGNVAKIRKAARYTSISPFVARRATRSRLLPKKAWKTGKMSEGVLDRMMQVILPFWIEVTWSMAHGS